MGLILLIILILLFFGAVSALQQALGISAERLDRLDSADRAILVLAHEI